MYEQFNYGAGETYRIMQDGQTVGGVVIKADGERGDLTGSFFT